MNGIDRTGGQRTRRRWTGVLGAAVAVGVVVTGCARPATAEPGAGGGTTAADAVTTSATASSSTVLESTTDSAAPSSASLPSPEPGGPTSSGEPTDMSGSASSIEGVTWTLVAALDKTGETVDIPDGVAPTLEISEDRLAVNTGCNSGGGSVAVSPSALEVGPIATTRMACDDARMQLEQTVLGVLSTRSSYRIDDSALTISNSAGTLVYQTGVGTSTAVRTAKPAPTAVTPLTPLTSVTLPPRKSMLPSIPEDPRGSTN